MSGRIRTIKPELLEDERTGNLTPEAFKLFVGVILRADDHGNLRAQPNLLERQVFCFAPPSRDIRELLAELSRVSLVGLYEVSGQRYAHVCGWSKHQKVDKPGKPRVPGPSQADLARFAEARDTLATLSRDPAETLAPDLRSPTTTPGPPTEEPEPSACAPGGAREAGGFESGSDSFGQGDPAAPEPDPSRAEPAAEPALPTKAPFLLRLVDPREPPPTPAPADPEVPMPLHDEFTLTLPGLDPQEAPRRPDAPPSRASGARRRPAGSTRGETAGPADEGRKNDSRELIEVEEREPPEEVTETQRQADSKARYAEAFARGVRKASGDPHFSLLSREHDDLAAICVARGKGPDGKRLAGPGLDAWLERGGADFARETAAERKFYPLGPRGFERWLREMAEAQAGGPRRPAGTYHGQMVQTDDAARRERERLERSPNPNTQRLERDTADLVAAGIDLDDWAACRAFLAARDRGAA